jgi:hypothetical protein
MNQEKADFVFEIAEFSIMSLLADILQTPIENLFPNMPKLTRPIYINKSFKRFYEIKPDIIDYDKTSDFTLLSNDSELNLEIKNKLRESVGFVIYCIKTVFTSYIQLLQKHKEENQEKIDVENTEEIQENGIINLDILTHTGLSWDDNTKSFYIVYFHSDIVKKNQLELYISKLIMEKKTGLKQTQTEWDMNWNITQQQLIQLEEKIKNDKIEENDAKINKFFKTKKRIGISIKEIKESEIPHQYRIKSLPTLDVLNNVSYQNTDD